MKVALPLWPEARPYIAAAVACALGGCFRPATGTLPDLPEEGIGVWFISVGESTTIVELEPEDSTPFDGLALVDQSEVELWYYGCSRDKLQPPSPGTPAFSKVQSGTCGERGVAPCPFDQFRLSLGKSQFDPIELQAIRPDQRTLQPWPETSQPPSPCLDFSPVETIVVPDLRHEFAEPTVFEKIDDQHALLAIRDRAGPPPMNAPRGIVQIWRSPAREIKDGKLDALVAPTFVTSTVTMDHWLGGTALANGGVFLVGDQGQTATAYFDGTDVRLERGERFPIEATHCRGGCSPPDCGQECGAQPCYATCTRDRACLNNPSKTLPQRDACVSACIDDCGELEKDCFENCRADPLHCDVTASTLSVVSGDAPEDDRYMGPEVWIGGACGTLLKQVGSQPWQIVRSSTDAQINTEGADLLWIAPGDVYGAGILPINVLHHDPVRGLRPERVGEAEGLATTALIETQAGIFTGGFFPLLGSYVFERGPNGWIGQDMVGSEDPIVAFHELPGSLLLSVDSGSGLFQYGPEGICPKEAAPAIPTAMRANHFLALNDHHLVVLVPTERSDLVMPLLAVFDDSVKDRCDAPPD